MTTEKFSVIIEAGDLNRNLGYIVEKNLVRVRTSDYNEMLVKIANNVIHGCFKVPSALGFSTPLDALGDHRNTEIIFRQECEAGNLLRDYQEWRKVYSTTPHRLR